MVDRCSREATCVVCTIGSNIERTQKRPLLHRNKHKNVHYYEDVALRPSKIARCKHPETLVGAVSRRALTRVTYQE